MAGGVGWEEESTEENEEGERAGKEDRTEQVGKSCDEGRHYATRPYTAYMCCACSYTTCLLALILLGRVCMDQGADVCVLPVDGWTVKAIRREGRKA